MPIIISKTYEIVTPESAEHGEVEECGFEFEDAEFDFKELVETIRDNGYIHPSNSHGTPSWLSTDGDDDYTSGARTYYSLHPGSDAISQRYWAKACKACGFN